MNLKINQILVIFSTIVVIGINYLATTGYIGGVTPNFISDKYPTYVTPAGFTFSIWGFIYLGLILFTLYQAMPAQSENFQKVRGLYILSCAANCVWIFLWHSQLIVASVGAMLVLLAALIAINLNLSKDDSAIARIPFGTYFGWITVAAIVNIAVGLTSVGVTISLNWALFLIGFAAIIGVLVRLKISNVSYGLAVTWGILGIALNYGGIAWISIISILSIIALLIAAITPFLRLHEAKR